MVQTLQLTCFRRFRSAFLRHLPVLPPPPDGNAGATGAMTGTDETLASIGAPPPANMVTLSKISLNTQTVKQKAHILRLVPASCHEYDSISAPDACGAELRHPAARVENDRRSTQTMHQDSDLTLLRKTECGPYLGRRSSSGNRRQCKLWLLILATKKPKGFYILPLWPL
eukprot:COSAG05_NODE_1856_length_3955_cov_1.812241_5_plen_170_part_00